MCVVYCLSCLLKNWYFEVVKCVFVDNSGLLRCCYAFVLPILEYCSPVCVSAAKCHIQFLERQLYSFARLYPDQTFLSFCHRRYVAELSMLYMVNSNSNHCLFCELPSASVRVRHTPPGMSNSSNSSSSIRV